MYDVNILLHMARRYLNEAQDSREFDLKMDTDQWNPFTSGRYLGNENMGYYFLYEACLMVGVNIKTLLAVARSLRRHEMRTGKDTYIYYRWDAQTIRLLSDRH